MCRYTQTPIRIHYHIFVYEEGIRRTVIGGGKTCKIESSVYNIKHEKRLKKGLFIKTRCAQKKHRLKNKNRKSPYREMNRTFVYFVFPNVYVARKERFSSNG